MNTETLAARIGVAASLAVLALAVVPYAVAEPSAVSVYYDAGLLGPPYLALFAIVVAVALQAGVAGRSDPATVAGVAVAFGGVLALLAIIWSLSVSPSVVGGVTSAAWFDYHRWAVALVALITPLAAALYARSVL